MKKAPTLTVTDPENVESLISLKKDWCPLVGPSNVLAFKDQLPDLQRKYQEELKKKQKPEKFSSDGDEDFIAVNVYDKPEEVMSTRSFHSRMQQP